MERKQNFKNEYGKLRAYSRATPNKVKSCTKKVQRIGDDVTWIKYKNNKFQFSNVYQEFKELFEIVTRCFSFLLTLNQEKMDFVILDTIFLEFYVIKHWRILWNHIL